MFIQILLTVCIIVNAAIGMANVFTVLTEERFTVRNALIAFVCWPGTVIGVTLCTIAACLTFAVRSIVWFCSYRPTLPTKLTSILNYELWRHTK